MKKIHMKTKNKNMKKNSSQEKISLFSLNYFKYFI